MIISCKGQPVNLSSHDLAQPVLMQQAGELNANFTLANDYGSVV